MNSRTASLALFAPRDTVFSYLSEVKNLPKWATEFCCELKPEGPEYKVVTPMGEMFFDIKADSATGVIDMFAGPEKDTMGIFPVRVLGLPGGKSVVLFTMFQAPDMGDEAFNGQYESLLKEFENIKQEFQQ